MAIYQASCMTCNIKFMAKKYDAPIRFCSVKCIRYTGNKDRLINKNNGFWKVATDDEKKQRIIDSFNLFVVKKEGCWGWSKSLDRSGYTRISVGTRKIILGHRASWLIHKGDIPDGIFVCHSCDNPGCTNPDHLFLGSPKDNTADCLKKGRRKSAYGENHYKSKLNKEQVIEIRELKKLNYSYGDLAKRFNVSPSTIQGIVERKRWKHI